MNVLGYCSDVLEDFINPRLPPHARMPIHMGDAHMLVHVLSNR